MKNDHAHCGCEQEQSDWRNGRYQPAESPEADQTVRRIPASNVIRPAAGRGIKTPRQR